MSYWFFVSYARQDSQSDSKLKQFYDELIDEIILIKHFPDGEAGFFDTHMELGATWEEELSRALSSCRVMLALCSPAYVNSEYCGKEFQVFHERQSAYIRDTQPKDAPHLILPILWGPPNKGYPQLIQDLQYTDSQFPAVYAEEGLKQMMRLSKHADDYTKFLRRLARIIVDEGDKHALQEAKPLRPLANVQNAFAPTKADAMRPGAGSSETGAIKKVWVIYVAARPGEIAGLRTVGSYGDKGRMEWQPYQPPLEKPVGVLAQEAVSKKGLLYFPLELETTDDLVYVLREAERKKEIVIILVDAWTMRIDAYRDFMKPYDQVNLSNCSVLIPWNEQDPETEQHRAELETRIKETFPFTVQFKRKSIYYRDSLTSDKALRSNLMKSLSEIRGKLVNNARDPESQPIQDENLVKQALEKGIDLENISTVQSHGGEGSD